MLEAARRRSRRAKRFCARQRGPRPAFATPIPPQSPEVDLLMASHLHGRPEVQRPSGGDQAKSCPACVLASPFFVLPAIMGCVLCFRSTRSTGTASVERWLGAYCTSSPPRMSQNRLLSTFPCVPNFHKICMSADLFTVAAGIGRSQNRRNNWSQRDRRDDTNTVTVAGCTTPLFVPSSSQRIHEW
jgi:hypothetical protein